MYAYKLVKREARRPEKPRRPWPEVSAEDLEEYEYYVAIASLTQTA